MSRTTRFLGGVTVGYVNMVLVTVAGLWLTPFILSRLGQEAFGLWLVGLQVIAYLALLDLGMVALLPRETAFATGRSTNGTSDRLPDVVARTTAVVLLQLPVVGLIALGVWLAVPAEWQALEGPLGLLLAGFVVLFPVRILPALLQGLQDLTFLGSLQVVAWGVGTGVTVALIVAGWGLYSLVAGSVTTQVLTGMGAWLRLRARFRWALPDRLTGVGLREAGGRLAQGGWVSASQVAQLLVQGTDLLLLGWLFGPAAVVPFACTQKLVSVLANQATILTQAAGPALSELRVRAERERLFEVSSGLAQAVLVVSGVIACVVVAVNRPFVAWWVGMEQFGGVVLTALFVANMLLRHWNTTLVYALFCFGYERRIAVTTLADGIVTVAAALIGLWWLGPIGAPIGAMAGVLGVSLPANLSGLARDMACSVWKPVLALGPWALRFAVALTFATVVVMPRVTASLVDLVAAAVVVVLGYGVVIAPVILRPPLGDYVRPRVASWAVWLIGRGRPSVPES